MLFVKVIDGEAQGVPITIDKIKERHKNVSFPKNFSGDFTEILAPLGYEPVPIPSSDQRPKPSTSEIVTLAKPEKVNGVWERRYTIQKRSLHEIQKTLFHVRSIRNQLLLTTDYVELPSIRETKSEEWKAAWDSYRQQLRDITDTDDIFNIKWPLSPNLTNK